MKVISVFPDFPNEIKGNVCPFFLDYIHSINNLSEVQASGYIYVNLLSVTQLLKCEKFLEFGEDNGQCWVRVNFIRIPKLRFLNFFLKKYLLKLCLSIFRRRFFKATVIHAHTLVCAASIRKIKGVRKVYTEHYSWFTDFNKFYYLNRDFSSIVNDENFNLLAVSKFMSLQLAEIGKSYFEVCYNPFVNNYLIKCSYKEGWQDISFIGRLEKVKQFDLALKAVENAAVTLNISFNVHIIGSGSQQESLYSIAANLNSKVNVIFYEQLSREETLSKLSQTNFMMISSKIETFSLVALEAAFLGVPVYSTKCGGPEEIISEKTGRVVPEELYIDSLLLFIRDLQVGSYDHDAIKEYAIKKFGNESFLKTYKKILLGS